MNNFHYGMHFGTNEEVVKDAIQKLFLRLWKKRKKLGSPHSIDGYLYVSLRRILLRKAERNTSRKHRNADFLVGEIGKMLTIEELIILQEEKDHRKELFREALQSLSPEQRKRCCCALTAA
ncbi:MAG: hypothetical protein U5K69_10020 [Balneolaceae bacterium]|nr:hypothetical protein [Balneolaceae bacterium]